MDRVQQAEYSGINQMFKVDAWPSLSRDFIVEQKIQPSIHQPECLRHGNLPCDLRRQSHKVQQGDQRLTEPFENDGSNSWSLKTPTVCNGMSHNAQSKKGPAQIPAFLPDSLIWRCSMLQQPEHDCSHCELPVLFLWARSSCRKSNLMCAPVQGFWNLGSPVASITQQLHTDG